MAKAAPTLANFCGKNRGLTRGGVDLGGWALIRHIFKPPRSRARAFPWAGQHHRGNSITFPTPVNQPSDAAHQNGQIGHSGQRRLGGQRVSIPQYRKIVIQFACFTSVASFSDGMIQKNCHSTRPQTNPHGARPNSRPPGKELLTVDQRLQVAATRTIRRRLSRSLSPLTTSSGASGPANCNILKGLVVMHALGLPLPRPSKSTATKGGVTTADATLSTVE